MAEPQREHDEDEGYFDPEGPGEHDHHLLDDDEQQVNDYVACPKCGQQILAFAERCGHCGQWFEEGEAWQAEHGGSLPPWLMATGVIVLVAFVAWVVL